MPGWASFIIGALVSPICYFGRGAGKKKLKIDDGLDAFGCHGIGGIWWRHRLRRVLEDLPSTALPLGWPCVWRCPSVGAQILGIVITIAVAVVGTLICVGIVRIFTPLRVTVKEEQIGLDVSQHGENAYPSFKAGSVNQRGERA